MYFLEPNPGLPNCEQKLKCLFNQTLMRLLSPLLSFELFGSLLCGDLQSNVLLAWAVGTGFCIEVSSYCLCRMTGPLTFRPWKTSNEFLHCEGLMHRGEGFFNPSSEPANVFPALLLGSPAIPGKILGMSFPNGPWVLALRALLQVPAKASDSAVWGVIPSLQLYPIWALQWSSFSGSSTAIKLKRDLCGRGKQLNGGPAVFFKKWRKANFSLVWNK